MFQKLLIANRGEIACRVMRTAHRMGLATVAVYSDVDASAEHVVHANEAYRIGPAPAAGSYLNGAAIIAAARHCGAEAVHPGYGFLSENAGFAEACLAAGLVFVGPSPKSIRLMGLKDEAKRLMLQAGVPVIPGYQGEAQDAKTLAAEAKRIGYPVLIKAVAGGGGKGIRRVDRPADFVAALETAQRESQSSFGDKRVLIEKCIDMARHIELQVFGDTRGNIIHLNERDCSLQRRHQKVIEEAPAPGMTPEMRAVMGAAAVEAARAVDYQGAGTIELLADVSEGLRSDRFYFMEMNTRLQVEHPVTERITGLDLVEWQLRVAAGEPLPLRQEEVTISGHAFEARVYAEDPAHDFRPAPGRIADIRWPPNARIESGVRPNDEITPFYDPMISKIIVHGSSRQDALNKLTRALEASSVGGPANNIGFLGRLSRNADVAAGAVDTGLIGREMAALAAEPPPTPRLLALGALAASGLLQPETSPDPWTTLTGWRAWGPADQAVDLVGNGETHSVRLTPVAKDTFAARIGEATVVLDAGAYQQRDESYLLIDGAKFVPFVCRHDGGIDVNLGNGERARFQLPDTASGAFDEEEAEDRVVSPMPGTVKHVAVKPGDHVAKGDRLAVVEAMKTEYALTAPRDGVIASVEIETGATVAAGAVLLRLEVPGHA